MASVRKRLTLVLLGLVVVYLSLYTWNSQTGHLDRLANTTGLEFVGHVLRPGAWAVDTLDSLWSRYLYLQDVERENERLRTALTRMALDTARLREAAATLKRLEESLDFTPPPLWERAGVRVLAQRLGPAGALDTVLLDRGRNEKVEVDAPLVTADGVLGRVLKISRSSSVALLATDPNSRIPVLGQNSRTTGILAGQGAGRLMALLYVPLADPLDVGEVLVTSGLGGVFPRGLPVARVTDVLPSQDALFKTVVAEPLVDGRAVSEGFVLRRIPAPRAEPAGQAEGGEAGADTPDGEDAAPAQARDAQ